MKKIIQAAILFLAVGGLLVFEASTSEAKFGGANSQVSDDNQNRNANRSNRNGNSNANGNSNINGNSNRGDDDGHRRGRRGRRGRGRN